MKWSHRRRFSAPRWGGLSSLAQDVADQSVVAHLDYMMTGSINMKVGTGVCVPFANNRDLSESGIWRLIFICDGYYLNVYKGSDHFCDIGICLVTDNTIIVQLTGTVMQFVFSHFLNKRLTKAEVQTRVESPLVWYVIMDGRHGHPSIIILREQYERWKGFEWYVTKHKSRFSIERYHQLARIKNSRHSFHCYLEMTLFDLTSNLRAAFARLQLSHTSRSALLVVKAYVGIVVNYKKMRTLVQTKNAVMRVPPSVIQIIGDVFNEEQPDVSLS